TGLKSDMIVFTEGAITTVIENYTREAGVRSLERELSSVCRKVARKVVVTSEKEAFHETVSSEAILNYLGPIRFRSQMIEEESEVGLATGLAWTEVGGEVLHIETTLMPGRGQLTLTGKLGEVMQESARAAISYVRSRANQLGISPNFYKRYDMHIHIPEGAIPKDGPSAGITMATSIVSILTDTPIRKDVAMTGEITLRGKVLPIGGLKEKLLAAHRIGIRTVIIPRENQKDLVEVPKEILELLTIHLVDHVDQVLRLALKPRKAKNDTSEVSAMWNPSVTESNQISPPPVE
ncbi:MAG TPA: magnesium chelatase domain-containing protein, partial [Acidobacteriota bacterium]|nr:magnesium chelatase domain-containing protein [Acidobacteriota bacterium]